MQNEAANATAGNEINHFRLSLAISIIQDATVNIMIKYFANGYRKDTVAKSNSEKHLTDATVISDSLLIVHAIAVLMNGIPPKANSIRVRMMYNEFTGESITLVGTDTSEISPNIYQLTESKNIVDTTVIIATSSTARNDLLRKVKKLFSFFTLFILDSIKGNTVINPRVARKDIQRPIS